jgi:type III secretion system FlhB-like substrate exporter
MAFGTGTFVTNKGKAVLADRVRTTPGTYTAAPKFVAIGVGATGAARTALAADTALSSEQETRVSGTESTVTTAAGVTGDTYQVVATITASAVRAVDESGLFDQLAVGGNMFTSATFPVVNLQSGDSVQFTWRVQLS